MKLWYKYAGPIDHSKIKQKSPKTVIPRLNTSLTRRCDDTQSVADAGSVCSGLHSVCVCVALTSTCMQSACLARCGRASARSSPTALLLPPGSEKWRRSELVSALSTANGDELEREPPPPPPPDGVAPLQSRALLCRRRLVRACSRGGGDGRAKWGGGGGGGGGGGE